MPHRRVCLVYILFAFTAAAATLSPLQKRDAPSATVDVPLTIDSDQHYVTNVIMSSGPHPQTFNFALVANSGYSAVTGTNCDTCPKVPAYNSSVSSSAKPFPGSQNLTFATGSFAGSLIKEDCSLREMNGSAWQYPNQTIVIINETTGSMFASNTSGIIGLGTNRNGGDFFDTIFGGWMIRNPTMNNFTFGMALNPPDADSEDGGVLHWLHPDPSFYEGDVAWKTVQGSTSSVGTDATSLVSSALPQSDWVVQLDGWSGGVGASSVSNGSAANAVIEPWLTNIYFPLNQAQLFYSIVPGAQLEPSVVDEYFVWSIPCNSQLSLTVQFGQTFMLDQSSLVIQQGTSCVGAIQAPPDDLVSYFIFGSRFISAVYMIFMVSQPSSTTGDQIGFAMRAQPNQPKTVPVGAIVGGTVGGLAVLSFTVLGIIAIRLYRRNVNRHTQVPCDDADARYTDEGAKATPPNSARLLIPHGGGADAAHSTSFSMHPLLPEPQSAYSPAIAVIGRAHDASPARLTRASGSSLPSLFAAAQDYTVVPYVVPSASSPPSTPPAARSWDAKAPRYTPHADGGTSTVDEGFSHAAAVGSGLSSDLPSPVSNSGTLEPYLLPPEPPSRPSQDAKRPREQLTRQASPPPYYIPVAPPSSRVFSTVSPTPDDTTRGTQ